jgi:predicted phage tail protein
MHYTLIFLINFFINFLRCFFSVGAQEHLTHASTRYVPRVEWRFAVQNLHGLFQREKGAKKHKKQTTQINRAVGIHELQPRHEYDART